MSARNCAFEGGNGVRFSVRTSTVIGAKQHRVADNFRNPAKTGSWGKGDVHCNRSTHAECGRQGKEPAGWAVQGRLPVVDTGRMNPSGGLMPVRPRRWAVRSGRGFRCRLEVGGTLGEARLCSTDQGPSDCTHLAPEQYEASAIGSQWSRLSLGSNASIRQRSRATGGKNRGPDALYGMQAGEDPGGHY